MYLIFFYLIFYSGLLYTIKKFCNIGLLFKYRRIVRFFNFFDHWKTKLKVVRKKINTIDIFDKITQNFYSSKSKFLFIQF